MTTIDCCWHCTRREVDVVSGRNCHSTCGEYLGLKEKRAGELEHIKSCKEMESILVNKRR